jgi:hypothetical protein
VTILRRHGGWQVTVYAGLDPLTGKQRQLTRQVNGSRRQAEKVEARLRTEVADGQHASGKGKSRPVPTPQQVRERFGRSRMSRTLRYTCG